MLWEAFSSLFPTTKPCHWCIGLKYHEIKALESCWRISLGQGRPFNWYLTLLVIRQEGQCHLVSRDLYFTHGDSGTPSDNYGCRHRTALFHMLKGFPNLDIAALCWDWAFFTLNFLDFSFFFFTFLCWFIICISLFHMQALFIHRAHTLVVKGICIYVNPASLFYMYSLFV